MRTFVFIAASIVCLASLYLGVGVYGPVDARQPNDAPREVKNSIGMTFIRISAGTFLMGSPAGELHRNADETQHEVTVTNPFFLGVHEVTQGQYEKIMGTNPSYWSANGDGKQRFKNKDTTHYPVERVSWHDAIEFCKKLSAAEKRTYRLPYEAEWELACRAGTKTVFSAGNDFHSNFANINGLGYSSYGKETAGPFFRSTVRVGGYPPNDVGLHDMHGNVQEWCADWYGENYYKKCAKDDPPGPPQGSERVLRGGAWPSSAKACRSALRNHLPPDEKNYATGFRVVMQAR